MTLMFDLTESWVSYLVGLAQTDGHLISYARNRGRLSIELARRDEDVLMRLHELIPVPTRIHRRTRTTNFKSKYQTTILNLHDRATRVRLQEWGVPVGRKTESIAPPTQPYSESDYVRGLVDGDGSVGLAGDGLPFLSLNTSSDAIAEYFIDFIHRVTGKSRKQIHRNTRDDCYNITVYSEDAVLIAGLLYHENCVCLERKRREAWDVKAWVRPPRRPNVWRRWTAEDDEFVVTHPVREAVERLGRSRRSIYSRRSQLRRGKTAAAHERPALYEWRAFSTGEDEYLLTHSIEDCVKHLGRNVKSIYSRRSELRRCGRTFLPDALIPWRSSRRFWTADEDRYVLTHAIEDSLRELRRTRNAITVRRGRLLRGRR